MHERRAGARRAERLIEEVRKKRWCGVLHVGITADNEIARVASAFGLAETSSTYREVDGAEARRTLVRILHRDLAYEAEIMPLAEAERLAEQVLGLIFDARFYTNGTFAEPSSVAAGVVSGPAWSPATMATLDAGVIALGRSESLCLWVEDED